ncbi:hypothetical protein HRI_000908800 [Hibiscus trionum]|uniref:CCHC-type domain-containing protein n=1 Tax=Hibiscus trionum TaxID=183268 RepID=A0A9W7LR70_HIBTR|nr:hypothetical protein HRI_000908800 [Hibiscus trionum]
MESGLAGLSLDDGEEEVLELPPELETLKEEFEFCLVGTFHTASIIHFFSMRNTLADIWHPLGGVSITELGNKRYCFKFYNEVDMHRVLSGCPWFFNNHLLLLHKLQHGEDPLQVSLDLAMFWVQIYDLPTGLMSEIMAKQFGNFIGKFIEYDSKLILSGKKQFMRIKVFLNVHHPLKRKKKVALDKTQSVYVRFQYERLPIFCFICGKIGHGEPFCPLRLSLPPNEVIFGWDLSLRAPSRRGPPTPIRWLRDEVTGLSLVESTTNAQMHGGTLLHGNELVPDHVGLGNPLHGFINTTHAKGPLVEGNMELGSDAEDNPLTVQDGNKRQRVAGEASSDSGNTDSATPIDTHDLSASPVVQGSRQQ